MSSNTAAKLMTIPDEEFNKKWDDLQNYVVLRRSKDPRFGEIFVLKHKNKKELIFSKEKWVNSKVQAAADIQDMKTRAALNHPNIQRFLGYSSAVDKQLCSTNYLIIGYYEFPKADLYKEIQDKLHAGADFPVEDLRLMANDALSGLLFLHQQQKIHGDIRPLHIGIDREERRGELLDRLNDPSPEDRAQLNNLQAVKEMYLSPELWAKIKGVKGATYLKTKNDSFALGMSLLHAGVLHNVQDVYKPDGSFNRERLEKYLAEFDAKYQAKDPLLARLVRGLLHDDEQQRWDTHEGARLEAAKPISSDNVRVGDAPETQITASTIPLYVYQTYAQTYAPPQEGQDGKVVTVVRPDGSTYTYVQRTNVNNNVIYNYDQSKLVYVQPFQPTPNVQYLGSPVTESGVSLRPSFVTVQRSLSPNSNDRGPTVVSTSVEIRRGSSIPYVGDQKSVLKKYEIKDDRLIEVIEKPADVPKDHDSNKDSDDVDLKMKESEITNDEQLEPAQQDETPKKPLHEEAVGTSPKGSTPEVPKISKPETPKTSTPEIPKVSKPETPKTSTPEIPRTSKPDLPRGSKDKVPKA